jgi:hypothetical protein
MEMKLYLKHVSFNGLTDADCNVWTMKMIQGMGGCQLLEVWEQLWSSWKGGHRPSNRHKTEDQLHINHGTIQHILHESMGKMMIWTKFIPHSLIDKFIVMTVKHFLAIRSTVEISYTLHSPDLMPADLLSIP